MQDQISEFQLRMAALDIAARTPGIKNSEVIVLAKEILAFIKGEGK